MAESTCVFTQLERLFDVRVEWCNLCSRSINVGWVGGLLNSILITTMLSINHPDPDPDLRGRELGPIQRVELKLVNINSILYSSENNINIKRYIAYSYCNFNNIRPVEIKVVTFV